MEISIVLISKIIEKNLFYFLRLYTVDEINNLGLYLNDLNAFDGSCQMIITEMQYLAVLEKAINKQLAWTVKLKETRNDLKKYSEKTRTLLNSMLPKHVVKKIESGVKPNTIVDVKINFNFKLIF